MLSPINALAKSFAQTNPPLCKMLSLRERVTPYVRYGEVACTARRKDWYLIKKFY